MLCLLVAATTVAVQPPEKVRMFGAKLDASMAGAKAVSRAKIIAVLRDEEDTGVSVTEKAEIFYAEAVEAMNRGKYERSVELLNRAVYFSGVTSRRGGQIQLWLAQALHAAGQTAKSVRLLASVEKHPDLDVRTVAAELRFIIQAPRLELNQSNFVYMDLNNFNDDSYRRRKDGSIERLPSVNKFREPPEWGTPEWAEEWAEAQRNRKDVEIFGTNDLAIVTALIALCSLIYLRALGFHI